MAFLKGKYSCNEFGFVDTSCFDKSALEVPPKVKLNRKGKEDK